MSKRVIGLALSIFIFFSFFNIAIAANNPPDSINADSVFDSITITLTTDKHGDFSAYTNDVVGYIQVASCWLQKKVDGVWVYSRSLPAPTYIEYNTIGYDTYEDYSSYIPSDGNTCRIAARFVADGHHATRYSNQRSF